MQKNPPKAPLVDGISDHPPPHRHGPSPGGGRSIHDEIHPRSSTHPSVRNAAHIQKPMINGHDPASGRLACRNPVQPVSITEPTGRGNPIPHGNGGIHTGAPGCHPVRGACPSVEMFGPPTKRPKPGRFTAPASENAPYRLPRHFRFPEKSFPDASIQTAPSGPGSSEVLSPRVRGGRGSVKISREEGGKRRRMTGPRNSALFGESPLDPPTPESHKRRWGGGGNARGGHRRAQKKSFADFGIHRSKDFFRHQEPFNIRS